MAASSTATSFAPHGSLPLRVAIVGTGGIAHCHYPAWRNMLICHGMIRAATTHCVIDFPTLRKEVEGQIQGAAS